MKKSSSSTGDASPASISRRVGVDASVPEATTGMAIGIEALVAKNRGQVENRGQRGLKQPKLSENTDYITI